LKVWEYRYFNFKVLESLYPTSQSPTVSPRKQFPAAPKRKKLLESGFENEAGNEKERRGMRME
jgi:hypothetical protein